MVNFSKDQKQRTISTLWTLVKGENEQPTRILTIDTDITERKLLEQQFRHAQRLESIGTLASGIAHDLNNVLAPILMGAEVLKSGCEPADVNLLVDTIQTSAQRGAEIVKQVLTFARGIEGQRIPLQARHLLREVANIARQTFPKSIQIKINVPHDLWQLIGDATQLHQVLLNLAVNARDAMPKGGVLSFRAENVTVDQTFAEMTGLSQAGNYVLIEVADTGTGIPPEIQDKIFDPFFSTKPKNQGTGLGLSTVLGIVKSHGGSIRMQTQVGVGSAFTLHLPSSQVVETVPASGANEIPQGNGELILLVDDEINVREVTSQVLARHHYRVLLASDGPEAIVTLAQQMDTIDLVITDIHMPFMDGLAFIRAARRIKPQIKVIACSGLPHDIPSKQLEELGVRAFIQKPFNTDQLLHAVHKELKTNSS
ncbi:MAG: ATP-binding protein [Verrucomicrobiota bacterium]|nr:ATP-binding protein [Verrucomicrobiota bacterium]